MWAFVGEDILMNWNTQRGGPWGGGGGHGPWGGGPGRPQPPDIEEMLRRSQDRVKRLLPSGGGGAKRIVILAVAALIIWFATGFYRVDPEAKVFLLVVAVAVLGASRDPMSIGYRVLEALLMNRFQVSSLPSSLPTGSSSFASSGL